MKKPSAKLLKTTLFLTVLALALSACGGKDDKGGASPSASPSATSSASPSESPSASPSASASESPSESPSAEASASVPAVAAGYKLFEDKVHGTTIQYPEDWTLKEGLVGIAAFLAPLEDANDTFAENINFIIEDLGGQSVTAADYVEFTKQQLGTGELIQDFELVEEGVDPEGADAAYLAYSGTSGGQELAWMQTVEIIDGKAYIVTFTATPDSFDKYIDQAGEIADSWTFK